MNVLVLTITTLLVGFGPLLYFHGADLWSKTQYQHFPFILAAIAYFVYRAIEEAPEQRGEDDGPKATRWPRTLLILGWGLLAVSIPFWSPWLAAVAAILTFGGGLWFLAEHTGAQRLFVIWCLCWLMIPLPFDQDRVQTQRLQRFSSKLSSQLLDQIGIPHLMTGNSLHLGSKQLFVDEACSGIVSVMSVIATAAIYGVWKRRSFLHIVLLVVAAIFWAVSMNIGRICVITMAEEWYRFDLASGWEHEILGLSIFLITFLATVSTDGFLAFLLAPIDTRKLKSKSRMTRWFNQAVKVAIPPANAPELEPRQVLARLPLVDAGTARMVIAGFAILGATQLTLMVVPRPEGTITLEKALLLSGEFLPSEYSGWRRTDFIPAERSQFDEFGENSRTYTYSAPESDTTLTVSVDFPFRGGWHELCVCYRNVGWTIDRREILPGPDGFLEGECWIEEAEFHREEIATQRAYLNYTMIDSYGGSVEPASEWALYAAWHRFRRRMLYTFQPRAYQIQVFVTKPGVISAEEFELAREVLLDTIRRFRESMEFNSSAPMADVPEPQPAG